MFSTLGAKYTHSKQIYILVGFHDTNYSKISGSCAVVYNLKSFVDYNSVAILRFLLQEATLNNNFSIWDTTSVKLANEGNCTTWGDAHCSFESVT